MSRDGTWPPTSKDKPLDLVRGMGFTGLGEAHAAGLVVIGTFVTADAGDIRLFAALVICVFAGIAGRWPLIGASLACWTAAAVRLDGVDAGPGNLALLVAVQAVGALGRWWLAVAAVLAADAAWLNLPAAPLAVAQDAIPAVGLAAAALIGMLRHRLHRQRATLAAIHAEEVAELRREIARDLHDSIAHDLTTLVLMADRLRDPPTSDAKTNDRLLADMANTARRGLNDLALILAVLRRSECHAPRSQDDCAETIPLERPSLADQLVISARRLRSAGFEPDITSSSDESAAAEAVDSTLAKCLAELTNNVIRHGQPGTSCVIRVNHEFGQVNLTMINSIGSPNPAPITRHLGLVGIRERVAAADGTVEAGRRANNRWVVEIRVR